jgi:hypothetical protein
VRTFRHHAGYWLLRAGICVLPRGRVKAELISLMDQWTTRVYRVLNDAEYEREVLGRGKP